PTVRETQWYTAPDSLIRALRMNRTYRPPPFLVNDIEPVTMCKIGEKGLRSLRCGGPTPNESTNQATQPVADETEKPVQCQVLGMLEN
ncbi:MAG: hypothetical protein RIS24_1088, partial [Verrucomicrobiota bacterium]